jgi:hypothetical protein
MLGNSKNGKCGLYGNLEKHLCSRVIIYYRFIEVFWCFYLTLKSTPKMLTNLTRAISEVLELQK